MRKIIAILALAVVSMALTLYLFGLANLQTLVQLSNLMMAGLTLVLAGVSFAMYWNGRDTSRRQLRAYIHLEKAIFRGFFEANVPNCKYIYKNYGTTPAHHVRARSTLVFSREQPDSCTMSLEGAAEATVGPNGELHHIVSGVAVPEEIRNAFEAGDVLCFLVGKIEYDDAFGDRHETLFSFAFSGRPGSIYNTDAGVFVCCLYGNEAS